MPAPLIGGVAQAPPQYWRYEDATDNKVVRVDLQKRNNIASSSILWLNRELCILVVWYEAKSTGTMGQRVQKIESIIEFLLTSGNKGPLQRTSD